tara:strand:+ start:368 stop:595 length:228 start_codon:yes stop_codon:yes gene_type:complete
MQNYKGNIMGIKKAKYVRNFKVEDEKEVVLEPSVIAVTYDDDEKIWYVPIASDNKDYNELMEKVKNSEITIEDAE